PIVGLSNYWGSFMSKYHRAFKLKLAQLAQESSSRVLGKQFQINSRLIRYWSQTYKIHGLESFLHSGYPYSAEFKLRALKTMEANDWSLSYTSAFFDLSTPGILFQWQKHYARDGISRLKPQKNRRPSMSNKTSTPKLPEQMTDEELREELAYLRAENDVLKKFEALAQARKKKVKTKR
ncbi:hypothetical protein, partial [Catenovulum agarivorans]|uniref:hypothetical protein n=1 Tax=Catenovulum agarivorans TaxID=1172192 RepID=UPI00036E496B